MQCQQRYSSIIVNADWKRWISEQKAWIPVYWKFCAPRGEILDEDAALLLLLLLLPLEWHGSDGVEALLYSYPVSEAREAGMMPGGQPAEGYNWLVQVDELFKVHSFCVHLNTSHGHFLFAVLDDVHLLCAWSTVKVLVRLSSYS